MGAAGGVGEEEGAEELEGEDVLLVLLWCVGGGGDAGDIIACVFRIGGHLFIYFTVICFVYIKLLIQTIERNNKPNDLFLLSNETKNNFMAIIMFMRIIFV